MFVFKSYCYDSFPWYVILFIIEFEKLVTLQCSKRRLWNFQTCIDVFKSFLFWVANILDTRTKTVIIVTKNGQNQLTIDGNQEIEELIIGALQTSHGSFLEAEKWFLLILSNKAHNNTSQLIVHVKMWWLAVRNITKSHQSARYNSHDNEKRECKKCQKMKKLHMIFRRTHMLFMSQNLFI